MPSSRNPLRATGRLLGPPIRWLARSPHAVFLLAVAGAAVVGGLLLADSLRVYHGDPFPGEFEALPVFLHVRHYAFLALWLMLPAFVLALLRYRLRLPILPVAIASALVFAIWASSEYFLSDAAILASLGIVPSPLDRFFRLALTGGLILSPPLLMVLYARAPILDRYLLRQFLLPFTFCFIGFLAIWLIIDLSDHLGDFNESGAPFAAVLRFYIVQVPQVVVLIAPVTLLLALLYAMGKMSRNNEIIAMLTAGKGLLRILRPMIFVGIYASLITLALNYEWAPQAEGTKETIHQTITDGRRNAGMPTAQMYRNRVDGRTWFVGRIPFDLSGGQKLVDVYVFEEGDEGSLIRAYYANKAAWTPSHPDYGDRPTWMFRDTSIVDLSDPDNVTRTFLPGESFLPGWSETPWKLLSGNMAPEHLGVPALGFHLRTNPNLPDRIRARYLTHWHARWATPWTCLVIVLVAAPLGIVYSRRGVLGGVASCVFIYFASIFLTQFFLALGQGNRIPAFWGAWTTNIVFAGIGLLLLHFRAANRDIPKPSLAILKAPFNRKHKRRTRSRVGSDRPEFT